MSFYSFEMPHGTAIPLASAHGPGDQARPEHSDQFHLRHTEALSIDSAYCCLWNSGQMARSPVTWVDLAQSRRLRFAASFCHRAARVKGTATGRVDR